MSSVEATQVSAIFVVESATAATPVGGVGGPASAPKVRLSAGVSAETLPAASTARTAKAYVGPSTSPACTYVRVAASVDATWRPSRKTW